jgi:hypothetical protein
VRVLTDLEVTEALSAYERWTWECCGKRILTLKHRLGYSKQLWILGFELLDDGRLVDSFHDVEVFDPASAGAAITIPSRYSAVPEMYCLLFTYAAAPEVALRGESLSLSALDPVRRSGLAADNCAALLCYADQDFAALQAVAPPFFGSQLYQADLAFTVWPLPRVPVTLLLWRGDADVADGGTLLFDRSAASYVPGLLQELAGLTVWRLRNILDSRFKWGYHQLAAKGK